MLKINFFITLAHKLLNNKTFSSESVSQMCVIQIYVALTRGRNRGNIKAIRTITENFYDGIFTNNFVITQLLNP